MKLIVSAHVLERMIHVASTRQLLRRRMGYVGLDTADELLAPNDDAACRELVVAMDGLPLALDQAGAYIEKTHTSLSAFLHLFQTYPL